MTSGQSSDHSKLWLETIRNIDGCLRMYHGYLSQPRHFKGDFHPVIQNIFEIPFKLKFENQNGMLLLLFFFSLRNI
jgi:hypothetical protein